MTTFKFDKIILKHIKCSLFVTATLVCKVDNKHTVLNAYLYKMSSHYQNMLIHFYVQYCF